jgi:tRNA(fMet)-specific endonuclease VapC
MICRYMLDTNICIYVLKNTPIQIAGKFNSHDGEICISSVVLSELAYGIEKSAQQEKNRIRLNEFLACVVIVGYDEAAAYHYGDIRADLERKGTVIGGNDLMIAAHARSMGLVLVSNNTKEFERVDGLRLENWC